MNKNGFDIYNQTGCARKPNQAKPKFLVSLRNWSFNHRNCCQTKLKITYGKMSDRHLEIMFGQLLGWVKSFAIFW